MSKNGGAGSVFVAFVLGAISGAAVALLAAPVTGQESREFLSERARQGRARAAEAAKRGREVVNEALERGQEAFQRARAEEKA